MLSLSDLLLIALAVLYWAYAISHTHGAFGMFAALRKRLPLGGLTSCPICLSFWLALVFWLIMWTPLYPIVQVSALAGAACAVGFYTGYWQQL